jgi:5-methyltetrahydrofolate--homocysteine methyltransferase
MLRDIVAGKKLAGHGVVGLYPANSVGDDIEVYTDETRSEVAATLYTLRQQSEKENDEPYLALADFVAPKSSGVEDYIGMFTVSTGFGLDQMVDEFKAKSDDYSYIMAEALADRLAEAFAEVSRAATPRGGLPRKGGSSNCCCSGGTE